MKLLVFAHRPPPLHGQSFMVAAMLDGFIRRPELGVRCVHVDARVSSDLANVGRADPGKLGRLARHVINARKLQRREQCDAIYYIPAPGQRTPLYRDWLALPLLRPAFPKLIFHWHSSGLGAWLRESGTKAERWISRKTHGRHDLSLVHSAASDPAISDLLPRSILCVPNGIPDPLVGSGVPRKSPVSGRLLFLGLCCREKGLFDALEALALLNRHGRSYHLDVGGGFPDDSSRVEFEHRVSQPDLRGNVTYHGFVQPAQKAALWAAAEVFVFPTFYGPESMPLVLLEAMAWSVPVVTTQWRALPDFLPPDYPGLVNPHRPREVAEAVRNMISLAPGAELRRHYETEFTLERHLEKLAVACRSVLPR